MMEGPLLMQEYNYEACLDDDRRNVGVMDHF
jgi:hypothetical protein